MPGRPRSRARRDALYAATAEAELQSAPGPTYKRRPITEYQREFIDCPERYTVVEASTKVGKTVGCIIWLTELALGVHPVFSKLQPIKRGANFWWCAPVNPQAAIAYSRLKRALPPELYTSNDSEQRLRLKNDTTLWFKSAEKPDNLYGEDVYGAVIDEASRCREEAWHAIRTTLTATRGPVKIIGNVKGKKNWAYDYARWAESGTLPDFKYMRITAWDAVEAGILARDEVEDAKRVLPYHVFRQDYEAVPADDGGNPFGESAIEGCIEPTSTGDPAVWGWDLAKAQDYTVGIALDRTGRVCRFERWQAPWRSTKADLANMVKSVPCLIDSTGVGDPVLEDLQAMGVDAEGFRFTAQSKQQLMEALAMAIHQHEVRFPDGVIVKELQSFEYQYTRMGVRYSARDGYFDDCVCSLALAVKHFRERVGSASNEAAILRRILAAYEVEQAPSAEYVAANPLDKRVW